MRNCRNYGLLLEGSHYSCVHIFKESLKPLTVGEPWSHVHMKVKPAPCCEIHECPCLITQLVEQLYGEEIQDQTLVRTQLFMVYMCC